MYSTVGLLPREQDSAGNVLALPKTPINPSDAAVQPVAQQTLQALHTQEMAARNALEGSRTTHANSALVNTCLNDVIPASDKFAVYRNGYKLAITAISLILLALSVSGVGTPLALALIGLGISIVCIGVLYRLYVTKKISKQDALRLAFMTIGSTFALFFGGPLSENVLLGLYAGAVAVQGALFAFPQAWAWAKDGANKSEVAKEVGDEKFMRTKSSYFSGFMSFAEGTTWMFMGTCMLGAILHTICPAIPEFISSEALSWVTDALFLGVFNISYGWMIGTGYRDLQIQTEFNNQLQKKIGEKSIGELPKEGCIQVLYHLRNLLTEPSSDLKKDAHRMSKYLDSDISELVTIKNIDIWKHRLEGDTTGTDLNMCRIYIKDICDANQRNIKLSKAQIKIGLTGLIVGSLLSLLGEFTNPGSVLRIPYAGDTPLNVAASSVTMADCGLWAYINHCYKTCLDAPEGRDQNQQKDFNELKEYISNCHFQETLGKQLS